MPAKHPRLNEAITLVTDHGYSAEAASRATHTSPHVIRRALNARGFTLTRGGTGGIRGRHIPVRIQARFLYTAGMPFTAISRIVGFSDAFIRDWVKTVYMTPTGYHHPTLWDGYTHIDPPTVTTNGADVTIDYTVDRQPVGRGVRLHPYDRAVIHLRLTDGWSIRRIAQQLGRHPSVISREIRRNQLPDGTYDPVVAAHATRQRMARPKTRKLDTNRFLRTVVLGLLNGHISPVRIARRLRRWFGTTKDMTLSAESIYQALYLQGKGALRHELTVDYALRSGRTTRKPKSKLPTRGRGAKPWVEGAQYSTRPAEAADRAVPGHWEGDLVIGTGRTAVVTLVERRSRLFLCRRLPVDHTSATVVDALKDMVGEINQMAGSGVGQAATLTWDQGVEMARVAQLEAAYEGLKVYFCDPHSPWQRPSNENINAELRRFYPKGTDFAAVSDEQLHGVQELINDTPRVVLDGATPREVFFGIETGPPVAFTA